MGLSKNSIHSVLLHLTTEHKNDGTQNNADFHVLVGNSINIKSAVKIVPVTITIPHFFPNIGPHSSRLMIGFNGLPQVVMTLPTSQYTNTQLALELTGQIATILGPTASGENIIVSLEDGHLNINNTPDQTIQISPYFDGIVGMNDDLWEMLGLLPDLSFDIPVGNDLVMSGMDRMINMAPLHTIFVHSSHLAPSNAITSDGTPADVVDIIDLSKVPYKGVAHKQINDAGLGDIDHYTTKEIGRVDIRLTDSKMRTLSLPPNYHPQLTLKVFYKPM